MAHFEVYGKQYPLVKMSEFRFSEWVLIREATGLDSRGFVLGHLADDDLDVLTLFGYAAVAFWRGNPAMSRQRVGAATEEWTKSDVAFSGDDAGEDAVPLDGADGGSTSSEASSETSEPSS